MPMPAGLTRGSQPKRNGNKRRGNGLMRRIGLAASGSGLRAPTPLSRLQPAAGAVGEYNGKFMSSQMVLRGSCFLTPTGHERLSYRNFFGPHCRWQAAGIRLAMDRS